MQQQQQQQSTGVHCKVTCDDQIRRFLFTDGTEFVSLKNQVKTILGLQEEFVLKYKDDEGDLVTISSNEELLDALKYSMGLLRLITVVKKQGETEQLTTKMEIDAGPWRGGRGRHGHCAHRPHDHQGHHHHEHGRRGGRGRHGRGGQCHPYDHASEAWTSKLTIKRDLLKQHLDSLGAAEATEQQKLKRAKLEAKLVKIEERLQKITSDNLNELEDNKNKKEKKQRKWEKKQKKWEKKERKARALSEGRDPDQLDEKRVPLSDEAKAQIASLKTEIQKLKPALKAAKQELRAKKMSLRAATRNGEETKVWEDEVQLWKDIKNEHKNQIVPLKEKIRSLKQQNQV